MSDFTFNEVKKQGIKSVKWVFFGNIVNIILKPLVTIILARLLVPEDFGVIGIATLIISFVNIFQDMGLGQALIQRKDNIDSSANVVFWSNLVFGLFVYIIIFLTAPLFAIFFKEPNIINVIRLIGIQIIINAFGTVQFALLQRDFLFQKIFWIRISPIFFSSCISIVLAAMGYGYWSLIWGALIGSVLSVFFAWIYTDWKPVFSFDLLVAKQLMGFGIFIVMEAIQAWALNYGDNAVVGRFIGIKELGIYAFGFNLMILLVWSASVQLSSIAYTSFSRLQSNPTELKNVYLNLTKLIILVSLPISVGLCITAKPIVSVIFGSKWQGLEPVLQILAIMPGLGFIWGLNPELYKAIGRPDIMPKVHLATIAYIIPVYLLVAPYGLVPFCLARASVGLIFGPLHIFICSKVLNLPKNYIWECTKAPLLAVSVMVLVIGFIIWFLGTYLNFSKLIFTIIISCIVYFTMVRILDKSTFKMFFNTLKQAI